MKTGAQRISEEQNPVIAHLNVLEALPPIGQGQSVQLFQFSLLFLAFSEEGRIDRLKPGRKGICDDDIEAFLGNSHFYRDKD
jgi:hypothetical protein